MFRFGILIALNLPASSVASGRTRLNHPVGNSETEGKLRAAQDPVLDGDGRAMQFGNALHDGEPKPGTSLLVAVAPPETLKDQFPFITRNSGTAIQHRHRAAVL